MTQMNSTTFRCVSPSICLIRPMPHNIKNNKQQHNRGGKKHASFDAFKTPSRVR